MKKIIAVVLVIAIVVFFIFRKTSIKSPAITTPVTVEQKLNLPESWKQVESSAVAFKLEKNVVQGIKPQITLVKSESKDALLPKSYVEKLIAGAKSAIPSLRLDPVKTNQDGDIYTAMISGFYYNQKTKISLIQRIIIKDQTVYTLTASFTGDEALEANQILDSIVKEKVLF